MRFTSCRKCGAQIQLASWEPNDGPRPVCPDCKGPRPPIQEDEQARRDRLHADRIQFVREAFVRGQRCLLARSLDPTRSDWAIPQPR
jgi:NAD-dependent SIR2 family protein deacetylase